MYNFFNSLLTSENITAITLGGFALSVLASILFGLIISYTLQFRNFITKSFAVTLVLLPAAVCTVIMMINGSIGAGIAVAGAFSLIRFRSIPGTAREITAIFIAMAAGLSAGMGYINYGFIFTIFVTIVLLILENTGFGENKDNQRNKIIRITIPEDIDYGNIFDDLFEEYTTLHELKQVKTSGMGSLFKLKYTVTLKDVELEKAFIDELRTRNGNLEISSSIQSTISDTL